MNRNYNSLAQSSNFKVFIPFLKDVTPLIQSIELPGMSFSLPETFDTSKRALVGADSITLDPVNIEFIIDENLNLYKKIVQYFYSVVNPNSGTFINKEFTCGIEITDNQGSPLICMQLYGCRIETLSPIQFNSNQEDNELTLTITLRFDDYELVDYKKFSELNSI